MYHRWPVENVKASRLIFFDAFAARISTGDQTLKPKKQQHDEGGEENEMGHSLDRVGLTVIEIDGGGDEGDEDHDGLNRCHRHDEGLAGIKRDAFHDRDGEDDRRQ